MKWFGLWERTSARGTRYFAGRIAGLKIVVLPNPGAGAEGPTHIVYLTEPNERLATIERPGPSTPAPRKIQNAYRRLQPDRRRAEPASDVPFNDPLPDNLKGGAMLNR